MQYQKLQAKIDHLIGKLNQRYQQHLRCGAGCSGCCHHHLSLFPVEAANVQAAIEKLPDEIKAQIKAQAVSVVENEKNGADVSCPLLINDQCAIYESRPIICRTQGLPLLYEAEDGEHEVDFCPLNFTSDEAIADLDEAHLIPLDAINLQLVMANIEYCRAEQIDPKHRIKIADLCK